MLFVALLIWRFAPLLFNKCKAKEERKAEDETKKRLWWYPFHMLALMLEYNAIYALAWKDPFLSNAIQRSFNQSIGQECQLGNPNSIGSLVSWAIAGALWVAFVIVYFCVIAVKASKASSENNKREAKYRSCRNVLGAFQLLLVCFLVFPYILSDNTEPIICFCNRASQVCSEIIGLAVRTAFIWLALLFLVLEYIITGCLLCIDTD